MKIDTNTCTTARKIEVMQAFIDGGKLECDYHYLGKWNYCINANWCWNDYNYRIRPHTAEEAAKEFYDTLTDEAMSDCDWGIKYFIAGAKWRDENPKEQNQ